MESKTVKKPNLHAKRRRRNVLTILNLELLDRFIEKYPKYKGLTLKEFREIVYVFNKVLWEEVIENIEGIELPEGLGEMYIVSVKGKAERMDMKKSISVGKPVYHRNIHTEGYFCDIFYINKKHKYNFANRELVRFSAHRDFKRTASKVYAQEWMKYRFLAQVTTETVEYKKIEMANRADEYRATRLPDKDYNEFDLD